MDTNYYFLYFLVLEDIYFEISLISSLLFI